MFIGVLDPNDGVRGNGELRLREAGIEIARFDRDLMGIIEELNRAFFRLHRRNARIRRTVAQTQDPVPEAASGPHGHPIGYTEDGVKVEWIPAEDALGGVWPLVLHRNDKAILKEYNELWDKVWYDRHRTQVEKRDSGDKQLSPERESILASPQTKGREIEERYGRDNSTLDDFEWGLLSGRMSALAWVLGAAWEESLDT